jgi:catechol 2,3-dioxygenase-like lactoylglutathione lyase family enzyme
MDAVGDLHLATVVVDVQDMERAVRFWCAALGYRTREDSWDPEFTMLVHHPDRTSAPLRRPDAAPARARATVNAALDGEGEISAAGSLVRVVVVEAREDLEMERQVDTPVMGRRAP